MTDRCDQTELEREVARRRAFALSSHPDAGKTTLTEKVLLYAGAVELAGAVRGRKSGRHATSDWMAMEQERGISVTSTALQFEYGGCLFNLLDTPGHQDFSEDTYRTLMAVDSVVVVLEAPAAMVLFSTALPGQGGTAHVHEAWPEYWVDVLWQRGFQVVDCVRPALWETNQVTW